MFAASCFAFVYYFSCRRFFVVASYLAVVCCDRRCECLNIKVDCSTLWVKPSKQPLTSTRRAAALCGPDRQVGWPTHNYRVAEAKKEGNGINMRLWFLQLPTTTTIKIRRIGQNKNKSKRFEAAPSLKWENQIFRQRLVTISVDKFVCAQGDSNS